MKQTFSYDTDHCIAALATAWGESALATIRTSGPGSLSRLVPLFSRGSALHQAEGNTLVHGFICDPETKETLDEVILGVFRAPASYTGEESVEISCHGNPQGLRRILDLLFRSGFRGASPGEFTFRAFVNGRLDLTRAEAVQGVIAAKTEVAQALALGRLTGSIEKAVKGIQVRLSSLAVALELQLDHPDQEFSEPDWSHMEPIEGEISALIDSYHRGHLYQGGAKVVLVGSVNAGKSSLFNRFLQEERAIVSPDPGTTRDYIDAWISLEGIPVHLIDTAGIRSSENPVEEAGVKRSLTLLEEADLLLLIIDGTRGMREEEEFIRQYNPLCLWNKVDQDQAHPSPEGFLPISAQTGEGWSALEKAVKERLENSPLIEKDRPVIDSLRQKKLLEEAQEALRYLREGIEEGRESDLLMVDLNQILLALGEILGTSVSQDIVDEIFSQFCIGK